MGATRENHSAQLVIITLYLTSVKIQIKDKTNSKSHNLQLGLSTPNKCSVNLLIYWQLLFESIPNF